MNNPLEIFASNRGLLLGYLLNKCRNMELAEDLCHDTYLRLHGAIQNGATFSSKAQLWCWIRRVASNLLIDVKRSSMYKATVYNFSTYQPVYLQNSEDMTRADNQIVREEERKEVVERLEALRPNWRETFNMHVVEGIQFKEIAQKKGKSIGSVLGEMRYARKALRKQMYPA